MMKNVKLDIAKTGIEISADIEAKAQTANALLHSGKGAGNDFLGWVHLPSSISENEIDAIRKEAAKLRSKADVVVCIGIGGSYLGAKAADTNEGAWRDNLVGQGDGMKLAKDGGDITAISGATITSRAVVTEVQTVINAAKSLG